MRRTHKRRLTAKGDIDLTDRAAVEAADRKRFEFVNGIVKEVEVRKGSDKGKEH